VVEHFDERADGDAQPCRTRTGTFARRTGTLFADDFLPDGDFLKTRPKWNDAGAAWKEGEFFHGLSPASMGQFESLAAPYRCEDTSVLLTEGEEPGAVLFLLEGKVKLSLNSIDGRRLILGIAGPGYVLGLAAVVSGAPSEITAEAQSLCTVTSLSRRAFLDFLWGYPDAGQNVGLQLCREYKRACEQLRNLGIKVSAATKLARLVLEWSANGVQTNGGMRVRCALTHGEIGECIGVARETVSRTLAEFKHRDLVEQRGSILFISNIRALEMYAEQPDCSGRANPGR
jgi:CRP/FNR family transcriptional regulator